MRILLITYYFPPCGGAPVQRWLRLLPPLIKHGMQITVLTSKDGDYPFIDHTLEAKLPNKLKVIRAKAPSLQRLWDKMAGKRNAIPYGSMELQNKSFVSKMLVFIRLNFIIPDLRIFWNPMAYRAACKELKAATYDAIITTGPPHSTHLVGMKLAKRYGIRFYPDFRDPWLGIHYLQLNPPLKPARLIHSMMERSVINTATTCFVVSDSIAKSLAKGKKSTLYNGYNPDDFSDLKYQPSDRFRIKYIGQLTAGQDIGVITELCNMLTIDYEMKFVGTKLSELTQNQLKQKLGTRLKHTGFVVHHEALKEMVDSDLLVMIVNNYKGSEGMLTTKLFEYLAAKTPILCFSNVLGEAAQIVLDTNSGRVFVYDAVAEAALWVQSLPKGHKNTNNISSYSVNTQADKLIRCLETTKSY